MNGTYLGFDFGEVRIGVAVGERLVALAHPLETLATPNNDERFARIATLLHDWQPEGLVVGLPTHADGTPHEMTRLARRFAQRLHGRFGLPVAYAEERLSSVEAEERLRASGHNARTARAHIDALAAQIILQSYFDRKDASA